MRISYNGGDITDSAEVRSAMYTDHAGGAADRLDMTFNDVQGDTWQKWPVEHEDEIAVYHDVMSTGALYVDSIRQTRGAMEIGAVTIPPELRTGKYETWETIRLRELLRRFADEYGLKLKLFNIPDVLYERLSQHGEPAMEWIARRCRLESCAVKLMGRSLIAYHEPWAEQQAPKIVLELADYPEYAYQSLKYGQCAGVTLRWGNVAYAFPVPGGAGRVINEADTAALTIAEAQRYAMGIARANNKWAETLTMPMPLEPNCAAGQTVRVESPSARLSGVWYVGQARHDICNERTTLALRRPLEGY